MKEPTATLPATRGHPAPMPPVATHSQEEDDEAQEVPIADVFFLSWPELYLEGVQSLIMIIAVYCALYFTNFASAAGSDGWKFLTFLPILICTLLLIYVVKSAVMLGAIHAVDCDAILEVLEQTEGARILSELIKEKVIGLLSEMGPDPQAELVNLFSEIDSDGSGSISRDEFAEYMNSIEIHFDRRRWMQVFRGIDTSFDNKVAAVHNISHPCLCMRLNLCFFVYVQITFEEFYVFLFPDHMLGQVSSPCLALLLCYYTVRMQHYIFLLLLLLLCCDYRRCSNAKRRL